MSATHIYGITIFLKLRQGPQDAIFLHIQNEKVSFIGEKFSMLFLWSLTLKQLKTLIFFFKNAVADILNCFL